MQVRKFAGAGQHFLAPGRCWLHAPARVAATLRWIRFCSRDGEHAAGFLDFLKQRPRRLAKLLASRSRCRRNRRRDRTPCAQIGFSPAAPVACCAPRARANRIGQSQRQRMRQHSDAVGAAEACGECRHGRAQHVHIGIALGQHPPCGVGGNEQRFWRKAAGCFDRAPTTAAARGILPCVRNWSASAASRA